MKKIFITILYRIRANDYWGFAITGDGEFLLERNHPDENELLDLLSDESLYGENAEIIYVHQFEFEKNQEFKEARMRSLHTYANASI